jgi:hypothetical protein
VRLRDLPNILNPSLSQVNFVDEDGVLSDIDGGELSHDNILWMNDFFSFV